MFLGHTRVGVLCGRAHIGISTIQSKYYTPVYSLPTAIFPITNINMYSSAQSTINNNMVAITHGQNQLTGASKDEYPKWTRKLRVLLNQLRVLDTDCGDKVHAYLDNPILPENYGKPRGKVTCGVT